MEWLVDGQGYSLLEFRLDLDDVICPTLAQLSWDSNRDDFPFTLQG